MKNMEVGYQSMPSKVFTNAISLHHPGVRIEFFSKLFSFTWFVTF